jgi:hypothetical protein
LKSTINNFSNLARFNPVKKEAKINDSENVSSTQEGQPSIKSMPLRDITKQVQHMNEELENEYQFDMSTESDQKEEFA